VIERDALLACEAEVLVLAADSNVVTGAIADAVRAPVVVEGANAALRPEADARLLARRVLVAPDVIASSSSAALVAGQMAAGNGHDPDALWARIERNIRGATFAALSAAVDGACGPREAFRRLLAGGGWKPEA
jgi:glutamate dehydrogenase (NAD(P)+)